MEFTLHTEGDLYNKIQPHTLEVLQKQSEQITDSFIGTGQKIISKATDIASDATDLVTMPLDITKAIADITTVTITDITQQTTSIISDAFLEISDIQVLSKIPEKIKNYYTQYFIIDIKKIQKELLSLKDLENDAIIANNKVKMINDAISYIKSWINKIKEAINSVISWFKEKIEFLKKSMDKGAEWIIKQIHQLEVIVINKIYNFLYGKDLLVQENKQYFESKTTQIFENINTLKNEYSSNRKKISEIFNQIALINTINNKEYNPQNIRNSKKQELNRTKLTNELKILEQKQIILLKSIENCQQKINNFNDKIKEIDKIIQDKENKKNDIISRINNAMLQAKNAENNEDKYKYLQESIDLQFELDKQNGIVGYINGYKIKLVNQISLSLARVYAKQLEQIESKILKYAKDKLEASKSQSLSYIKAKISMALLSIMSKTG